MAFEYRVEYNFCRLGEIRVAKFDFHYCSHGISILDQLRLIGRMILLDASSLSKFMLLVG